MTDKNIIAVFNADCPWVVAEYDRKIKIHRKVYPDALIEYDKEIIAIENEGRITKFLTNIGRIYTRLPIKKGRVFDEVK
jgi:hypothetical protein